MPEFATILGDGQMALVLADALRFRGVGVRIWGPIAKDTDALAKSRISPRLPGKGGGFKLDDAVEVTGEDRRAFQGATVVLSAIPSEYLRRVWQRLKGDFVRGVGGVGGVGIVSVTKGIEIDTDLTPTQVIADVVKGETEMCALSGPSIAAELAKRLPASLVAASSSLKLAERVQDLLRVPWLRIYSHDDVAGVEIAGAAKNVIALAAGMLDGLEAGVNAKSALLARGLAEIARLGMAMSNRDRKIRLDTFFGIAGAGDLATTCFAKEGRNRTCGERLARGETLEQIIGSTNSVIEGVPTTRSVMQLAQKHNVQMPITEAVQKILFEGLTPREAIRDLMSREFKAEQVGS